MGGSLVSGGKGGAAAREIWNCPPAGAFIPPFPSLGLSSLTDVVKLVGLRVPKKAPSLLTPAPPIRHSDSAS